MHSILFKTPSCTTNRKTAWYRKLHPVRRVAVWRWTFFRRPPFNGSCWALPEKSGISTLMGLQDSPYPQGTLPWVIPTTSRGLKNQNLKRLVECETSQFGSFWCGIEQSIQHIYHRIFLGDLLVMNMYHVSCPPMYIVLYTLCMNYACSIYIYIYIIYR